jgi:endonuclease/exonuclease/phosphatase family metal-dependent hydrolase
VDSLRDCLNADPRAAGLYDSAWAVANGAGIIRFFEGSAILSRFEILSAQTIVYRAQALLPPESRIALRARIRASGGDFTVIGTHLTNTDARRRGTLVRTLQARELAAWAGGASLTIIGGDFNSPPGSPPIRALLDAGAQDVWEAAAAAGSAAGPGLTALGGTVIDPKDGADERIDYLFLLGTGAVVESARPFLDRPFPRAGGGVLWASDHIGVLARFRLGGPP